MIRFTSFSALFILVVSSVASADDDPLSTIAERSGFQKTGRYDEVIALCAAFKQSYPQAVRSMEFGRTPEGRPMLALIVSRTGILSAEEARNNGRSPISIATGGRGFLEENLSGSSEAEACAGAVVESIFHPAYLVMGNVAKVGSLGKILAD
jgi:Zinc carboxypeptidase